MVKSISTIKLNFLNWFSNALAEEKGGGGEILQQKNGLIILECLTGRGGWAV